MTSYVKNNFYSCLHCRAKICFAHQSNLKKVYAHDCFKYSKNICLQADNTVHREPESDDLYAVDPIDDELNTELNCADGTCENTMEPTVFDANNPDDISENKENELDCTLSGINQATTWTTEAVQLLVQKFEENREELEKKNTMKKHIWTRIAGEMNNFGYNFSWDQLQNKWKSLIRTYKSIRDNNNETGRSRKNWMFFEAMDRVMGKNPTIDPPLALHNGKCVTNRYRSNQPADSSPLATQISEDSDEGHSSRDSSTTQQPRKKQKRNTDINDLLLAAIEQDKKHHEEDLQEKRRFNDLLEIIVNNMKK